MPLTNKQEHGGSGSADQEPEAGIWEMGNLMENLTFCAKQKDQVVSMP